MFQLCNKIESAIQSCLKGGAWGAFHRAEHEAFDESSARMSGAMNENNSSYTLIRIVF